MTFPERYTIQLADDESVIRKDLLEYSFLLKHFIEDIPEIQKDKVISLQNFQINKEVFDQIFNYIEEFIKESKNQSSYFNETTFFVNYFSRNDKMKDNFGIILQISQLLQVDVLRYQLEIFLSNLINNCKDANEAAELFNLRKTNAMPQEIEWTMQTNQW